MNYLNSSFSVTVCSSNGVTQEKWDNIFNNDVEDVIEKEQFELFPIESIELFPIESIK